ncbi:MAG: hypothetical protein F4013_03670 [Gammaproteobacteria bacterium]|nr:hypothetical protein [Gammaproteobacteria bacterium]
MTGKPIHPGAMANEAAIMRAIANREIYFRCCHQARLVPRSASALQGSRVLRETPDEWELAAAATAQRKARRARTREVAA